MMEEFEMKILVLNCGSSSLKYQLIDMENEQVLTKGLCERIGIDGSVLTHKVPGKDNYVVETPMPDHSVAVQLVLDALTSAEHGVIKSVDEINAIGHRVLHGGTKFINFPILCVESQVRGLTLGAVYCTFCGYRLTYGAAIGHFVRSTC